MTFQLKAADRTSSSNKWNRLLVLFFWVDFLNLLLLKIKSQPRSGLGAKTAKKRDASRSERKQNIIMLILFGPIKWTPAECSERFYDKQLPVCKFRPAVHKTRNKTWIRAILSPGTKNKSSNIKIIYSTVRQSEAVKLSAQPKDQTGELMMRHKLI